MAISQDLDKRYNDMDTQQFLLQSCALDPRFRALTDVDDATRIQIYASIVMQTVKVNEVSKKFTYEYRCVIYMQQLKYNIILLSPFKILRIYEIYFGS